MVGAADKVDPRRIMGYQRNRINFSAHGNKKKATKHSIHQESLCQYFQKEHEANVLPQLTSLHPQVRSQSVFLIMDDANSLLTD